MFTGKPVSAQTVSKRTGHLEPAVRHRHPAQLKDT